MRALLSVFWTLPLFLCSHVVAATTSSSSFSKNPGIMRAYLKKMFLGMDNAADTNEGEPPQDMLVIGAGLPRTGTGSLYAALKQLGLKPYHMKTVMEVPGQVEMWSEFVTKYQQERKPEYYGTVLDNLSQAGFNASLDGPMCFFYKEQMKRYPDAKVILTIRGGENPGESWARSCLETVFQLQANSFHIPWNLGKKAHHMLTMGRRIMTLFFPSVDPTTNMPNAQELPKTYYDHVAEVQAQVPAERLLVLDATKGDACWEALCDFLSPLSPSIGDHCEDILESGQPYPHVNARLPMMIVAFVMRSITILTYGAFPASLLIAWSLLQRRRQKEIKRD